MESEEISFENSCRLCLKRITGKLLRVSIFETDSICHSSIPVKIKTCVCIDVQAADPLPQCICLDCHNKLDDFFAFKQVCSDADLKLKTLLLHATGIANGQDVSSGSYVKTIKDIGIQSTIKIEPHSEEEEYGLAEAMELDALSDNSDDAEIGSSTEDADEIRSFTSEHSASNERLPFPVLNTPSLTVDLQKPLEINIKREPYDNCATTEMPGTVVFDQIKTEITEQQPLDEDIPLAHYMRRKINGVHNGNFIYNIDDEVTSDNRPKTKQKKTLYSKYDTFRKNYRCESCSESFRRLSDMRTHLDTHLPSEMKRFVCCVCPESFSEKRYLEDHEQQLHTNGSFYLCKQCTTSCATLLQLKRHVKTHQEIKRPPSFVCNRCKRTFEYQTPFRNHVQKCSHVEAAAPRVAVKSVLFGCDICGIVFNHKGALICHQAMYHRKGGTWTPQFKCVMCDVTCPRKKDLTEHEAYVHGKAPADTASQAQPTDSQTFSCGPCNLSFKHKGALICHQAFYHRLEMNRKIVQARPFPCEVCQVVFARKDHYIIHKESHKYDAPTEENGSAVG